MTIEKVAFIPNHMKDHKELKGKLATANGAMKESLVAFDN